MDNKKREREIPIRTEACRLAVQTLSSPRWEGQFDPVQLEAMCVFFDSYIWHGSAWTRKHMKLGETPSASVLKLVTDG